MRQTSVKRFVRHETGLRQTFCSSWDRHPSNVLFVMRQAPVKRFQLLSCSLSFGAVIGTLTVVPGAWVWNLSWSRPIRFTSSLPCTSSSSGTSFETEFTLPEFSRPPQRYKDVWHDIRSWVSLLTCLCHFYVGVRACVCVCFSAYCLFPSVLTTFSFCVSRVTHNAYLENSICEVFILILSFLSAQVITLLYFHVQISLPFLLTLSY